MSCVGHEDICCCDCCTNYKKGWDAAIQFVCDVHKKAWDEGNPLSPNELKTKIKNECGV